MTAFWVVGIGINLAMLVALAIWVVRNWKGRDSADRRDPVDRR